MLIKINLKYHKTHEKKILHTGDTESLDYEDSITNTKIHLLRVTCHLSHVNNSNQCVANIRIFKDIWVFLTNISIRPNTHGFFKSKYIGTFIGDFFSPNEYNWTFIRNVGFQGIHSNEAV